MSRRTYLQVAGSIFSVVALLHGLCVLVGWRVSIAGIVFPVIFNIVAFCIAASMAYFGFKLSKQA